MFDSWSWSMYNEEPSALSGIFAKVVLHRTFRFTDIVGANQISRSHEMPRNAKIVEISLDRILKPEITRNWFCLRKFYSNTFLSASGSTFRTAGVARSTKCTTTGTMYTVLTSKTISPSFLLISNKSRPASTNWWELSSRFSNNLLPKDHEHIQLAIEKAEIRWCK